MYCDQEESMLFFMEALALIRLKKKTGLNGCMWYSRRNGGRESGEYEECRREGYSGLKGELDQNHRVTVHLKT